MKEVNPFLKMNEKEYDEYMCETYPDFFADRFKPMTQTCMCWGFNIGKGWYKTLDEACKKLKIIQKNFGVRVIFDQIKEKFGSGRFYYHLSYSEETKNKLGDLFDLISDMIETILIRSENDVNTICANCGERYYHGKIVLGSWVYDICEKCLNPKEKEEWDKIVKNEKVINLVMDNIRKYDTDKIIEILNNGLKINILGNEK